MLGDPTPTAKPFFFRDSAAAVSGHGGFRGIHEHYRAILEPGADQFGDESQVGLQAASLGSRIKREVTTTAPDGGTSFVMVAHSRDALQRG